MTICNLNKYPGAAAWVEAAYNNYEQAAKSHIAPPLTSTSGHFKDASNVGYSNRFGLVLPHGTFAFCAYYGVNQYNRFLLKITKIQEESDPVSIDYFSRQLNKYNAYMTTVTFSHQSVRESFYRIFPISYFIACPEIYVINGDKMWVMRDYLLR